MSATAATIERAKAERSARDATGVPNRGPGTEKRWVGTLAELGVAAWLRRAGADFEHHGGIDSLPDFHVAGRGVGLKCRTATQEFRPSFVVNVFDHDIKHREQDGEFFFTAFVESSNTLLLLGGMSREEFVQRAFYVAEGELINPYRRAATSTWSIRADRLESPADWLARVSAIHTRAAG